MRSAWIAVGAMLLFASAAWSEAPAPTAAADTSKLPPEVKAVLDQMQKTIEAQNQKIAALEARQGNDEKARREEIIAVLKEMNLLSQKKAEEMSVYYRNGLKFETADGNFKLGLNGRIFFDSVWISAGEFARDTGVDQPDGVEIRQARIMMSGDIYKDYFYCWEFDFAHNASSVKDVYFGMKNIPYVGAVRVGHFREPFSMTHLTSDSIMTFMERPLPFALVPDRGDGIMANNMVLDKRMTWAAGVFRDTGGNDFANSDRGYNLTGRLTGLPYYANDGRQLLHLGAGYSFRTMNDPKQLLYRSTPEVDSRMISRFIQTDATATGFSASRAHLFAGEIAGVWNSFHAESEFIASRAQGIEGFGDPCYKGVYAQAGYFLTGEVRPYNRAAGTFDRVKPLKNFREKDGLGAWEVAARYSYLDLNEMNIGVNRGEMSDVTLGLNWYLNPMIRLMWNYIHAMPNTAVTDGDADIFMMRFQIDF